MDKISIEPYKVIGISVRTTNENNQSAKDIPLLWEKFIADNTFTRIPGKTDETILSIYTDYEKDHTRPYTTILGCRVDNLDHIPDGMVGRSFDGGTYLKFTVKGDLTKNLVIDQWVKIWEMELGRIFTADFEVYGKKAQNPSDAEVDILIAVK